MRGATPERGGGQAKYRKGEKLYFADTGVGPLTVEKDPVLVVQDIIRVWVYECSDRPDESFKGIDSPIFVEEYRVVRASELNERFRRNAQIENVAMAIVNGIVKERRLSLEELQKRPEALRAFIRQRAVLHAIITEFGFSHAEDIPEELEEAFVSRPGKFSGNATMWLSSKFYDRPATFLAPISPS